MEAATSRDRYQALRRRHNGSRPSPGRRDGDGRASGRPGRGADDDLVDVDRRRLLDGKRDGGGGNRNAAILDDPLSEAGVGDGLGQLRMHRAGRDDGDARACPRPPGASPRTALAHLRNTATRSAAVPPRNRARSRDLTALSAEGKRPEHRQQACDASPDVFRRRRDSCRRAHADSPWLPAFAGMTGSEGMTMTIRGGAP